MNERSITMAASCADSKGRSRPPMNGVVWFGSCLIVFGAASVWDGLRIRIGLRVPGAFDVLGPDGYMIGLGAILVLLGVMLAVAGARIRMAAADEEPAESRPASFVPMLGVTAGYAVTIVIVGYLVATVLFFVQAFYLQRAMSRAATLPVSIVLSLLLYGGFVAVADMPLPKGLFPLPDLW